MQFSVCISPWCSSCGASLWCVCEHPGCYPREQSRVCIDTENLDTQEIAANKKLIETHTKKPITGQLDTSHIHTLTDMQMWGAIYSSLTVSDGSVINSTGGSARETYSNCS